MAKQYKLNDQKKKKILKTYEQAMLGTGLEKGEGDRQALFDAFRNKGARGVLKYINQDRIQSGNPFGKISVGKDGKIKLKDIRRSISDPEQLAKIIGNQAPLPEFDEAGARSGQEEMTQFYNERTNEELEQFINAAKDAGVDEDRLKEDYGISQQQLDRARSRFGEDVGFQRSDLGREQSRFGEQIGTNRSRLAASQAEADRFRKITENDELLNQNTSFGSRNIAGSPAAERLAARLAEVQQARSSAQARQFSDAGEDINTQERYGTEDFATRGQRLGVTEQRGYQDFDTQKQGMDLGYNRSLADSATRRGRLSRQQELFENERRRSLQEILGQDMERRREKFYNQPGLPSSQLSYY